MVHPHGKDLRKGRVCETGRIYLLTAVTCERRSLFADWRVGRLLAKEFGRAQEDGLVESLAWVIMTDHFHWLIALDRATLSSVMQRVKSRSAIAINKHLRSEGKVWQKGFHDRALRRDEDSIDTARYVVANPLRAGLAKRLGDYPLWNAAWLP